MHRLDEFVVVPQPKRLDSGPVSHPPGADRLHDVGDRGCFGCHIIPLMSFLSRLGLRSSFAPSDSIFFVLAGRSTGDIGLLRSSLMLLSICRASGSTPVSARPMSIAA